MVVTCPLCGYRFDPDSATACKSCPLNFDCEKICCPNCQYGWVKSSFLAELISKAFRRRSGAGDS